MRNSTTIRLIEATRASMDPRLDRLLPNASPCARALVCRIGQEDWVVWCSLAPSDEPSGPEVAIGNNIVSIENPAAAGHRPARSTGLVHRTMDPYLQSDERPRGSRRRVRLRIPACAPGPIDEHSVRDGLRCDRRGTRSDRHGPAKRAVAAGLRRDIRAGHAAQSVALVVVVIEPATGGFQLAVKSDGRWQRCARAAPGVHGPAGLKCGDGHAGSVFRPSQQLALCPGGAELGQRALGDRPCRRHDNRDHAVTRNQASTATRPGLPNRGDANTEADGCRIRP